MLRPVLTELDVQDAIDEMDHVLDIVERELNDQAVRDGLTGLYNRRRFDETLQKEWDRHKREGNHLSLIMAGRSSP